MLCRGKKGKSPSERMTAMFSEMLFDNLRAENPDSIQKVIPVIGDVLENNLGELLLILLYLELQCNF